MTAVVRTRGTKMSRTHHPHGFGDVDNGRARHRVRDLRHFAPLAPLSTAGGCLAIGLCLWPVLPPWWPGWLASGLVLALAQWQGRRIGRSLAAKRSLGHQRWVLVNALVSGVFWGVTSVAFYPTGSVEHQLLLAFNLTVITVVWLPFYAFVRLSLLVFTVPAVLPMAFELLSSPTPPQTTMGSLLLLLIAVFAAIAA